MPKTDKEMAVELVSSYVSAWFSRENVLRPLDSATISGLVKDAYDAIHSLPSSDSDEM